jgi:uncharacterized protein (DUF2147 family)
MLQFRLIGIAFVCMGVTSALADPRGVWLAKDGARVRVASCGAALCGTLVSTNPARDPATGRPFVDAKNPDPSKAKRPLIGITVFISMQPTGPGKWSGRLYDTDRGITVDGHLIERDAKTLRVEGCAGAICGGEDVSGITTRMGSRRAHPLDSLRRELSEIGMMQCPDLRSRTSSWCDKGRAPPRVSILEGETRIVRLIIWPLLFEKRRGVVLGANARLPRKGAA